MPTTRDELEAIAHEIGVAVRALPPVDGMTRYRFFLDIPNVPQSYAGATEGLATVQGLKMAESWLRGFESGFDVALSLASSKSTAKQLVCRVRATAKSLT